MTNRTVDQILAALAARQHGAFTHGQALLAGATESLIKRRLGSGAWLRRGDGLYVLPSAVISWEHHLRVALLDHGMHSFVSHRAASAMHTWPGYHPGLVELSSPGAPNYRGIGTMHRTIDVVPSDLTVVKGLPVTTQLRTAIDMASLVGRRKLEWLIDDLLTAKAFTLEELTDRFHTVTRRGKPGMANLRSVVESRGPGYVPPASRLERLLIDVLTAGGLPEPVRQHPLPSRLGPGRVDLAYPVWRLIIEADSRRWHTRNADFETDRNRDNEATLLGWFILRYTWKRLMQDPAGVVAEVSEFIRKAALV
jgi:very-short-patch-repair endonuclease